MYNFKKVKLVLKNTQPTHYPTLRNMATVWSPWEYSECSATCGSASKIARRTCIYGCSNLPSNFEERTLSCEVDLCPEEPLEKMCTKPTDVFEAQRKPIYQDCFVEGEHDNKYNLINGQFRQFCFVFDNSNVHLGC